MLISLRSTKGIYPSAPVVNKNHCQKKMDADAFSQLLQLQFFQFAQVAEQFLVKSVMQPFSISKTEKQNTKNPPKMTFLLKNLSYYYKL